VRCCFPNFWFHLTMSSRTRNDLTAWLTSIHLRLVLLRDHTSLSLATFLIDLDFFVSGLAWSGQGVCISAALYFLHFSPTYLICGQSVFSGWPLV